jgi:hypothetical protein
MAHDPNAERSHEKGCPAYDDSKGRSVKLLPQPGEDDAADRLNAYLKRAENQPTRARG